MCCCAAANVEQIARYIGFDARGWAVTVHHEANPGYRSNDGKLRAFARNGNWKKNGPALLATCPYYTKDGPNPAGWHGWSSTMIEYDSKVSKHHIYEYGYSQGYRLDVQLRPGQRLVRNWLNKGLHVNMDGAGGAPDVLKGRRGLGLQRKLGDIAPGRVGNGTFTYQVPLADRALASAALAVENLTASSDGGSAAVLRVRDAAKPGLLILRMPSSYVYLGGDVALDAMVGSGGSISVSFSDNHGLDWKKLAEIAVGGERKVGLKPHCCRRYDCRLKLECKGAGTGLRSLRIAHDIQHSQAPLPALGQGENTITFSTGRRPSRSDGRLEQVLHLRQGPEGRSPRARPVPEHTSVQHALHLRLPDRRRLCRAARRLPPCQGDLRVGGRRGRQTPRPHGPRAQRDLRDHLRAAAAHEEPRCRVGQVAQAGDAGGAGDQTTQDVMPPVCPRCGDVWEAPGRPTESERLRRTPAMGRT